MYGNKIAIIVIVIYIYNKNFCNRRFSVLPGAHVDEGAPATGRRVSIMPWAQRPAQVLHKLRHPLGFQDFDT